LRLLLGLGLYSSAVIAFQLSLMQLISIVQWHHFAYMIISIALMGFGASGTVLALARKNLLRHEPKLVPLLFIASGLLMVVVFQISRLELLRFDVFVMFGGGGGFWKLVFNYLLFSLPFFLGALAIGIIFISKSKEIGSYYFSNLLGSGMGGLLALFLISWLSPKAIPVVIGCYAIVSGLIVAQKNVLKLVIPTSLLAFSLSIIVASRPFELHLSEYKAIEQALNLPEAKVTHQFPSVHGLVEVVHSPAQRFSPAVSFNYTREIQGGYAVFVNGDYYGHVINHSDFDQDHILNFSTLNLPYVVSNPEKVLILNAGAATNVSHAVGNGARQVDAVIPNRTISQLLKTELHDASGGILSRPEVRVHNVEPRNFLWNNKATQYDLIVLPIQEGFGGTSGLGALREEFGLTTEAFEQMVNSLSPQGMISISTWTDYPPRTSLRIPATLIKAARGLSPDHPEKHIAAIRSWGTITFVLKREPFNQNQIEKIRGFCNEMLFDPLLLPGLEPHERQYYNIVDDTTFFDLLDRVVVSDTSVFAEYAFNISPATDNKPYFNRYLKLGRFEHLLETFGADQLPFLELGYLTLLVTLVQALVLAFILIILPLFFLKKSKLGKGSTLLYFGAIGLGYMFAEIILIQRFILYFGAPVYSVVAVISTMLVSSGLGSFFSKRVNADHKSLFKVGSTVAAILLLLVLFLQPILQGSISAPIPVKVAIGLLVIGIPAFVMGFMFPLGVRLLDRYDSSQIPWAWGINGCLSVTSTSLATLLAVEKGFNAVILIAVVAYLIAAIAFSIGGLRRSKSV